MWLCSVVAEDEAGAGAAEPQHGLGDFVGGAEAVDGLVAFGLGAVELTVAYEGLEMAAEPGLTLTIYTAEPGSPSEEGLRLLASWAATQETEPSADSVPSN